MPTHSYLDHVRERKEMAFLRWMRSGYRDFAAHDEYIRWYEEAQRVRAIQRECAR